MRVWKLHEEVPGLAMSRSFGAAVAESLGVIAVPEVNFYQRKHSDRALIVCSDGLIEFIQNQDICNTISEFYDTNDTESAANKLIQQATASWEKEEPVIDDITVIVIFIYPNNRPAPAASR